MSKGTKNKKTTSPLFKKLLTKLPDPNNLPILLDLYVTFCFLSGISFGGGYSMIPILQRSVVTTKGWATQQEFGDYCAIGQVTPGIIAINVATFVGQAQKGWKGAVVANLGLITPCILIILFIGSLFTGLSSTPFFSHGLGGIQSCVVVLVGLSAWKIVQKSVVDKVSQRIFYTVFTSMVIGYLYPDLLPFFSQLTSPSALIIFAGLAGYLFAPKQVSTHETHKDEL